MEKNFISYGIHIDPSKFNKIEMGRMKYANKPDGGLWASREDLDSWRQWCESEGFRIEKLNTWTKFKLESSARILKIDSLKDLSEVQKRFPLLIEDPVESYFFRNERLIDFQKIEACGYDGVYLTERGNRQCHLPMSLEYSGLDLNAWDVESLVLFNLDHVIVKEMG